MVMEKMVEWMMLECSRGLPQTARHHALKRSSWVPTPSSNPLFSSSFFWSSRLFSHPLSSSSHSHQPFLFPDLQPVVPPSSSSHVLSHLHVLSTSSALTFCSCSPFISHWHTAERDYSFPSAV